MDDESFKESIRSILKCKYENCDKYLVDPIKLECDISICREHLLDMKEIKIDESQAAYNCKMCGKEHKKPENGFRINQDLNSFLKLGAHLSEKQKDFKNNLDDLKSTIDELKSIYNDPDNYLYEYFSSIKNEIDLRREEVKHKIDEYSDAMIEEIDHFSKECRENLKTFEMKKIDLKEYEDTLTSFTNQFTSFKFNLSKSKIYLNEFNEKCQDTLNEIKNLMLNDARINFEFLKSNDETLIRDLFGNLEFETKVNKKPLYQFADHGDKILACIPYPTSKFISSSADQTIKIWSIETNECLKTFKCESPANFLALNFDQTKLVSRHLKDQHFQIWDLENNSRASSESFNLPDSDHHIQFFYLNRSSELIYINDNQKVSAFDLYYKKAVKLVKNDEETSCIIVSPLDWNELFVGYDDGSIKVYDAEDLSQLKSFDTCYVGSVTSIEITSHGLVIACINNEHVVFYDIMSCKVIKKFSNMFRSLFFLKSLDNGSLIFNDFLSLCETKFKDDITFNIRRNILRIDVNEESEFIIFQSTNNKILCWDESSIILY